MIGSVFRPMSQVGPEKHPRAPDGSHPPKQPNPASQMVQSMSGGMPPSLVRADALGAGQVPPAFPTLRSRAQPIVAQPTNQQLAFALMGA